VKLALLAVTVLVVALPTPARAADPTATLSIVDVPLAGQRTLASARPSARFDLVGLHWQGNGTVSFRTRHVGGSWSGWHAAAPEAEDLPDTSSVEAGSARGWRFGSPWWVGASDRIAYRVHGQVRRLRAYLVRSPAGSAATRTLSTASSPAIVPRSGWDADEAIRKGEPQYADTLRFAIVHHTAGANTYTRAEAPAVVRAIELYHVKANGWNDIGYNFLVDRFGTVYEGRYGGVERNVVGAHALGFNTGSVGVAVIGTYGVAPPSAVAMDSLARLLAWRLDLAHVDPLSILPVVSGGSERWTQGTTVMLRAISGHRDTGLTACPGDGLYSSLGTLAARVAAIGLPKLYEPVVSGEVGGLVRFQARLSSSRSWSVTVSDAGGTQVASGAGIGSAVDWTWDSTAAPSGEYTWQMAADGVTPAGGTLSGGVATATLALADVAADPITISPNGDGVADASTVTYRITAPATVGVAVLDANGTPVATLQDPIAEQAGAHTVGFDANGLGDGGYTIRIDASDAELSVSQTVGVLVTRTLGNAVVAPRVFSPNGDGRADRLVLRFTLLNPATVRVRVLRDGHWVATAFTGQLAAGRRSVVWDGSKRTGRLLDGAYTAEIAATDAVGTSVLTLPFTSDIHRPVVRVLPGKPLRIRVSEPASVSVRVNGRVIRLDTLGDRVERVPWTGNVRTVRAVAWDAAGNVSKPVGLPGSRGPRS
jgi:flagellar hook assembly protein FlgD